MWAALVPLLTVAASASPAGDGLESEPLGPRSGPAGRTLFTELSPAQTGVVTTNDYSDPQMWGALFHESEVGAMGTGIAIADYDGDGRPDLFVVSKTESCRLFRNLGGFKFEDVTDRAGVGDAGEAARIWKQGATFADVNNDGRPDLYVCRFNAPNLLYINQGDGTFKESAHAAGLDVKDASGVAAFCDYDRDGWLDVFVQTNLLDFNQHPAGQRNYLFHNNRDGTFTDVTDRAGIAGEAQGHSATWWDFNDDGWPDLYVANDFAPRDRLYRNNHDGTFTDVIDVVVPHMPYSAMGSDLGDVNNDGRIDLFVADMAGSTHERDMRGMAESRERVTEDERQPRLPPQYPRSALYLGTGTGRVLEAAYLAGVAATDWTWSPRFEDLDNDGRLDLVVTNGMHRESTNLDLLARQMSAETTAARIRVMRDSPVLAQANFAFRNRGDLQFENVGAAWGLDQRGVSFGSAFADFDGDGDLDYVFANYHQGVTLLRNDSASGHRIIVALRGTTSNRFGVGATVRIETAAGPQVRQLVLARGYQSTSEQILHFGLGDEQGVRQLTVTWPSGLTQTFAGLAADRRYTITEPARRPVPDAPAVPFEQTAAYEEVAERVGLAFLSREDSVDETSAQRLLPRRLNRRGPALAVGRLASGGPEAVVIGGTSATPALVALAPDSPLPGGRFSVPDNAAVLTGNALDDGPVLLLDADGDGNTDLLVTKGGNLLPPGSPEYRPHLLLGDGRGGFRFADRAALPAWATSVGAVAAADFDHDGRLDVFVGGRVQTGDYPFPPASALWHNTGGAFTDVTTTVAPGLRDVGMVTAALWTDIDADGWPDLLVALEWGPVKCFHNDAGRGFSDWTERTGFAAAGAGWWTSLAAADFNGDGRPDYVAGNTGLNTPYQASRDHPVLLFTGDFNGDGEQPQLIEAYYEGDRLYPRLSRNALGAVIPSILRRFPRNDVYARAPLGEILGEGRLAAADRREATELRSGVFLSQPDGTYRFTPLPRLAQIAPWQGIVAGDFDGDGYADIYAVQNSYAPVPAVGRFDGGLSQLLRGDGRGGFTPVPSVESGLVVPRDAKALATFDLDHDGWPDFVVTRNNDTMLVFRRRPVPGRRSFAVALRGAPGNPTAVGARITVELTDGTTQTTEVYAGSGCYSQSGASPMFGYPANHPPRAIRVMWPSGARSVTPLTRPPDAIVTLVAP